MSAAQDRMLNALRDRGSKVSQGGRAATCPAHEDHAPSLSIGRRRDGDGVLLRCHAGCPTEDVLAALNLTAADLFDHPRQKSTGRPQILTTYPYTDEADTLLYEKVRYMPKDFRLRRPDGAGGWIWRLDDVRRVPYRLPEVVAAIEKGERIYVCEGEKDADALAATGVTATTWPEGAWTAGTKPKWRGEYTSTLTGADVVVVADRDDAGRHTAATIASLLTGVAASVTPVEPVDGKDASDHLGAGRTVDELVPVGLAEVERSAADLHPGDRRAAVGALLADLRTWQHLPDPAHVVAALAAAATRHVPGEPCWLLMVAAPSSGKTEAARILDDVADARLDEVTSAGLLGWTKGKSVRPSGVLTQVGEAGLVTFGDLSSLLATSDRGGRDQVFGLLRSAYDGHVSRGISPPGRVAEGYPDRLEWTGRLTVVACVTGIIDRYAAHADQLGPRWVYVRLPERTATEKRSASQLARRGGLAEKRERARGAVAAILDGITPAEADLDDDLALSIEDASLVTAWGRGSVPRNGYGRREIEGMPVVEEPMRLVQQLGALARGVLALGLPTEAASALTRRVALDSMPQARRAVLAALSTGEPLSTAGCARAARLDRKVARMSLEDLAVIGVVSNDRADDESDELTGTVTWFLAGEDGSLIAEVFAAYRRLGGWDETWVYTSPSPPEEEKTHPPSRGIPTFRPTPDESPEDTPTGPVDCDTCGQPLLLHLPGRTTCGACTDRVREAS